MALLYNISDLMNALKNQSFLGLLPIHKVYDNPIFLFVLSVSSYPWGFYYLVFEEFLGNS